MLLKDGRTPRRRNSTRLASDNPAGESEKGSSPNAPYPLPQSEREAGTNLVYAATHQFGDPERIIPARPFLGVSDEDNRFIVDTLVRHIDPKT